MYILIGADIVPTSSNEELFIQGDKEKLLGKELCEVIQNADYRILNLEVPLVDTKAPILKHGPNHSAPISTVARFKAMGINLFTLANNHILDQDEQGLAATIDALDRAGISHFGTGNSDEASKPFCIDFAGKKIGLYACTEHEFSLAEPARTGANPFDPLWSLDHVDRLCYSPIPWGKRKLQISYTLSAEGLQKTCG
ncbi:MAG: CapA family protein [Lachnospiraceae bacterium]|nr:CapA family protein [Lachnospiraceae bacterium]